MNENDLKAFAKRHARERKLVDFASAALVTGIQSSLAQLIEKYLGASPSLADKTAFAAIGRLNQGTLDDLTRAEFVSYVVSYTSLSPDEVMRVRQSLRTFVACSNEITSVRMAARGETQTLSVAGNEMTTVLSRRTS